MVSQSIIAHRASIGPIASEQKTFKSVYLCALEKGQTMTLTSSTYMNSDAHLVDYKHQLSVPRLIIVSINQRTIGPVSLT